MSSDLNLDVSPKLHLEAAGFRLASLEADHSIIYMLNPDLRIIYCNKAWDEFASLNGGVWTQSRGSSWDVHAGRDR